MAKVAEAGRQGRALSSAEGADVTHTNGLTDLYLMTDVLAKARTTEPLAEAPRTAKRIAMLSRRKHARQLGNR